MPLPESQNPNPTKQRGKVGLDTRLDKNLRAYETAASADRNPNRTLAAATITAVGLGILALPSADAKVVFTPANELFHGSIGHFPVDLNNDGIPDVSVFVYSVVNVGSSCEEVFDQMAAYGLQTGNGVVIDQKKFAAAGRVGQEAGPFDPFAANGIMATYAFNKCGHTSGHIRSAGPWRKFQDRFLGVRFVIAGQTHYGWLRLQNGSAAGGTLTGYAYETIANKPIKAGYDDNQKPIPEALTNLAPGSLGRLAAGADASRH